MGTPLDREALEDESGARQVECVGDDLGRMPAVVLHDADGVAGILDGVPGPGLDVDGRCRNALRLRHAGHYLRLDKAVVHSAARKNQPRSHAALILVHCLGYAGELHGRRVAVIVCRVAEDDDGVKARERGVAGWGEVPCKDGPHGEDEAEGDKEKSGSDEPDSSRRPLPGGVAGRGPIWRGRTAACRAAGLAGGKVGRWAQGNSLLPPL